jgi:hypothetical protein
MEYTLTRVVGAFFVYVYLEPLKQILRLKAL